MRAPGSALAVTVFLSLACAPARAPLPGPALPLTPTPDAPFRASEPPADHDRPLLVPPSVEVVDLPRGPTLAIVRAPGPLSAVAWSSRGAGACGPPSEAGLAALTMRMLLRGTRLTDGRVLRQPRVAGMPIRSGITTTHGVLLVEPLSPTLPVALDLVSQILTRPAFDEGELELARVDAGESAYVRSYDATHHLAAAVIEKLRGGEHCAARSSLGRVSGLERYGRVDVEAFHRRALGLAGTLLVVVTDRPAEEVTLHAKRHFAAASLPGSSTPSAPRLPAFAPPRAPSRREHVVVLPGGDGLAFWTVGFAAPPHGHVDALPMALVAHVLGASSVSRVNAALRHQEGSTYGVGAELTARADAGELLITSACDPADAVRSVRALLSEVERLAKVPVTDAELDAARAQYLATVGNALSSPGGIALALGELHALGAPLDYHDTLEARLRALTSSDLKRAAVRWLDGTAAQIALFGAFGRQWAEIATLGELEIQRLAAERGGA